MKSHHTRLRSVLHLVTTPVLAEGEIPTTDIVFDTMKTRGIPLDIAVECGFRAYGMEATCVLHRTTPAHEPSQLADSFGTFFTMEAVAT